VQSDSVKAVERNLVILRHVNKVPSLAACSKCQLKFFTPYSYFNDRSGAEQYLHEKFDLHRCDDEHLKLVR
jgi:hypothetical protein